VKRFWISLACSMMKLLFEGCFNVGLGAALPDPSVALSVSPT
jgi:hypothetical protein